MQVIPFIVETPGEAVEKIRARLGPEAVVLNIRKIEPEGLGRLWQKPRMEVLAYRPEPGSSPETSAREEAASLRRELDTITRSARIESAAGVHSPVPAGASAGLAIPQWEPEGSAPAEGTWRIESLLEHAGFLPVQAKRVVDLLQTEHGETPPPALAEEIAWTRALLRRLWRKAPPLVDASIRPHVFIGPSGSGKTTALCKWLTQLRLVEGRLPRVWRLDGTTANSAETLSLYGEVLGVPVERSWRLERGSLEVDIGLIDLPGVDWRDAAALADLRANLGRLLTPHLHLVLNAAYEVPVLLAQLRAFSVLPISDLIFTHLDEEPRWGKLWNFILGTNCTIRFLGAGQNVPGDFQEATAERLLARFFPAVAAA